MKLMKNENEAGYQMLRMTGLVVGATEEKNSTSTNAVTLIDT